MEKYYYLLRRRLAVNSKADPKSYTWIGGFLVVTRECFNNIVIVNVRQIN